MISQTKDVSNISEEFKRLNKKTTNNSDALKSLGIKYTNKIGGLDSAKNDELYSLLDAFRYRHNCNIFHLRYIANLWLISEKEFTTLKNDSDRIVFLLSRITEFSSLFDSLIFHSISGFDYCAHLIDYVCNDRLHKDRKWSGIVEAAKNKSIEFCNSQIAPVIVRLDDTFVSALKRRRNQVIHYETDIGRASTKYDFKTQESSFNIFAPKQLIAEINELQKLAENNNLTMLFVSCWVTEKVCDVFSELIINLNEHVDLNRKTESGILFIKDVNGVFHEI